MREKRIEVAVPIPPEKGQRLSRWRVQAGDVALGGHRSRDQAAAFAEGWNTARQEIASTIRDLEKRLEAASPSWPGYFGGFAHGGPLAVAIEFGIEADEPIIVAGLYTTPVYRAAYVLGLSIGGGYFRVGDSVSIDEHGKFPPLVWKPQPVDIERVFDKIHNLDMPMPEMWQRVADEVEGVVGYRTMRLLQDAAAEREQMGRDEENRKQIARAAAAYTLGLHREGI